MEKMTKRKRQAIRTKNKILETALPMIREKGFANVSVDEICMAAGIAKGTFYHYFDSKERIFGNTGIMMDDQELGNLLDNEQMSSLDKLCILIDDYMNLAENQGTDITRQIFKSLVDGSDIYNEETLGREVLRRIVEEGVKRQEFKSSLNVEEVIDLVLAFSVGQIVYWCNEGGNYDLRAKTHNLMEKWLRITLSK